MPAAFPESKASRNGGWWDRTKGRLPGGPFTIYKEVRHQRGEPLPGDTQEYKTAAAGQFNAEQIARCWLFAIRWLTVAFPSRFRDRAAGYEWARVTRDKDGQLIGKDGERLRGYWYKEGKRIEECSLAEACRRVWSGALLEGKYCWSLDGQIAHEHDFYDDATWLHHHRIRAEVHADACRLLAKLIEADAGDYGKILKSLAPRMPQGRPGDPEPVEPTPEALLATADDLMSHDRISPDNRKAPRWHATLRLFTEWALAYGRWIEENRSDLLTETPTLHALLRCWPDERAGRFARYDCAGLARELRLIAAKWDVADQSPAQRSPVMSLERLSEALGADPRTIKKWEAERGWDLRREGKQSWTVSYARMGNADIARIHEAYRSRKTRRSKPRK